MGKQSNLEKIGFERRNEYELLRNDYTKENKYDINHESAKWHEGEEGHPIGKGTGKGYEHTLPREYNEMTKNQIRPQLDIENGGGSYDINGRPGVDGGRKLLQTINVYSKERPYGWDAIDTELNENDGQYFVK